jgi:hypothetical protein
MVRRIKYIAAHQTKSASAMLEAAGRELASGRDVVAGFVETHGRKETDALTEGLPIIPQLNLQPRVSGISWKKSQCRGKREIGQLWATAPG